MAISSRVDKIASSGRALAQGQGREREGVAAGQDCLLSAAEIGGRGGTLFFRT